MNLIERITLDLFDVGAVRFGEFRLKLHEKNPDAPLSPIYIDLRQIRSHPFLLRNVAALLGRTIVSLSPDFVADVPTAATPIVGTISASFDIPMLTPRTDKKEHGTKAAVDGAVQPGSRVVVVDDLITKADSKLAAIDVLEAAGLVVEHIVVLVDRKQGGEAELRARGYTLHAATALPAMLEHYERTSRITREQRLRVTDYLSR